MIISKAQEFSLNVVKAKSSTNIQNFQDLINSNQKEAILVFLKEKNLERREMGFDFSKILWMLSDKEFFLRVLEILRARKIYNDQVWSYAFYHKDFQGMKEMFSATFQSEQALAHFESSLLTCGGFFNTERVYDFYPLINSRAHQSSGSQSWTLNKTFVAKYTKFLQTLV